MMRFGQFLLVTIVAVPLLLTQGCSPAATPAPASAPAPTEAIAAATGGMATSTQASPPSSLTGDIAIDGSSTVYPITEAAAEEFGKQYPGVRVAVGIAGTGGGFKKFCNGETDINDASRPIKDEEKTACEAAGIAYTPFQIGLDGISIVVNANNDWVDCLTVAQLKAIWDQGSTVKSWNEVDPSYPDIPLDLYGPGTDSGTFDFFTEQINGEAKRSRPDYTASEDDNTLVQGIAGDEGGLGYFGLAYYLENQDKLKDVAVDAGKGCVKASMESVADGTYVPLSRPLFLYVKNTAFGRPEVYQFVRFYLEQAPQLVPAVDYVALDQSEYGAGLKTLGQFAR